MARSAVNLKFSQPVSNDALKSNELPSRIKVLPWGVSKTLDGEITLDEQSAKVFYDNQKKIGRTTAPLDFNHNTVQGTKAYAADKEPRAIAGYGVPTLIPGDGLYFEFMQWTPSGRKSAKDYMDLSPTVVCDSNGHVLAIHSCALTPAGQIENLTFYSADSLHLYSADSMPTLIDKCSTALSTEAKDEEDDDDEDDKPKEGHAHAEAESADNHVPKYGDVDYADTKNSKYPINTEAHVRAAWSYIHIPKNEKGYTPDEISAIKHKIAAKAKQLGIEIKANSADDHVQVNAYVTDPYKGIDAMLKEDLEHFRKALGMDEGATPDDILKKLRATWEGVQADKQVLPQKTPGSSTDPAHMDNHPGAGKVELSFSADEVRKLVTDSIAEAIRPLSAELTPLKQELATLKTERNSNATKLEAEQRKALVDAASRDGKVIPLSAEEVAATPIAILESMVKNLTPSVPMAHAKLRPLSADGKVPAVATGSYDRGAAAMTGYFKLEHTGPVNLGVRDAN